MPLGGVVPIEQVTQGELVSVGAADVQIGIALKRLHIRVRQGAELALLVAGKNLLDQVRRQ